MSWDEYNDMWDNAQEKGQYHLYVFDIKGSKKSGYFRPQGEMLLYKVYFTIMDLEKERNITILHRNDKFNKGDRGDLLEPFFFSGDLLGFTTLRDTISPEEVYSIFRKCKENLNIKLQFHYDNGYYETDDWGEALNLYFRGYCMQYLENRSKFNEDLI